MNANIFLKIQLSVSCCFFIGVAGCRSATVNSQEKKSPVVVLCAVHGYTNNADGKFLFDLTFNVFANRHPVVIDKKLYYFIDIYDENEKLIAHSYSSPGHYVRSYQLLAGQCVFPQITNGFEFVSPSYLVDLQIDHFTSREQICIRPYNVDQKFSEELLKKAHWVLEFGVTTYKMEPDERPIDVPTRFNFDSQNEGSNWIANTLFRTELQVHP